MISKVSNCYKKVLRFRQSFIILLIVIFGIVMPGCTKKEFKNNVIEDKDIFLQKEIEYYVYFYQKNCLYCDDVFKQINDYIENPTGLTLYVCDLTNSFIKREYQGGGIDGPNGKYVVDYVTSYDHLYIPGFPSIIKIDSNRVSWFVTSGRKGILDFLENNNLEQ